LYRGQERVELYLYFPYEPYGLYRASVPVQGYTLPFFAYSFMLEAESIPRLLCGMKV